MKHMRGLVSTTYALRQTFLPPLQIPRIPFSCHAPTHGSIFQNQTQNRQFHAGPWNRPLPPGVSQKANAQKQLEDENIRAEFVQIVNEDGKLEPPARLSDLLRGLDRPSNFILQVSPGSTDRPPVCKIVSRKALLQKERTRHKAEQAAKKSVKAIELNWATDAHDLSHRMKQLVTFLEKGRKVEITLARKKGKRAPTVDEIKNLMDTVVETTKAADAMQIKPMEGEVGKTIKIYVKKKDT